MSILTPSQEHWRHCQAADWDLIYHVGDIRICPHGRIQVGYEVMGCTAPYFRDLSRVYNPILWRRAKRLITQGLPERLRWSDLEPPDLSSALDFED